MALELLLKYRKKMTSVTLAPSAGGRFEVSLNDTLLFSKLAEGRFPALQELTMMIDEATTSSGTEIEA